MTIYSGINTLDSAGKPQHKMGQPMDDITQPHDKLFRRSMQEKAIAIDFLRASLPTDMLGETNLSTLASANGDFVKRGLMRSQSDAVYRCKISNSSAYILAEHQSSADSMMSFRLAHYGMLIMDDHLRQGHKKLPLVVPMVLYHGKRSPYPHSELCDCFAQPKFAKGWATPPFHLIDLTKLSDANIAKYGLAFAMLTVLKNCRKKHVMPWLRRMLADEKIAILVSKIGDDYLCDIGIYLLHLCGSRQQPKELEQVLALLAGAIPKKRENLMTFAQQLKEQGMQQGMQQGMHQKSLEVAKRMLAKGMALEDIEELTGLSDEELAKLH